MQCHVFLGSQTTWQPGRQINHLNISRKYTVPSRKRSIRSVISKVTLDYSNPELLKPSKKTVPNHIDWRINKF